MKKLLLLFFLISFLFSINAQKNIEYAENQLIIKFKEDLKTNINICVSSKSFSIKRLDELNSKNNLTTIRLTGNKKEQKTFLLKFNQSIAIDKMIVSYLDTGLFQYVEPNFIGYAHGKKVEVLNTFPNEILFNRQWSLYNNGTFSLLNSTFDADIDMELAWDIETGSPDIIVAVLDTGTAINHPEFNGRIWVNPNEIGNDGADNDSNGYVDDINGWNFESQINNVSDFQGHGTNVAGIIGVNANNNIGYAGVDWNCKLMICRILDDNGSGFYSWWSEAIYYAVNNGAKVLNMSVGGNGFSQTLKDAVDFAYNNDVSVVVSSGNGNVNGIQYPSRYSNAIAVGSTNPDDKRTAPFFWSATSGSNYGVNLDLVAPGGLIYGLTNSSNTNYNTYWGGTSQAAPHVTGVISLLLAQNASLTAPEIKTILQDSADDQVGNAVEDVAGFDIYHGYGRLNANAALQSVAGIGDYQTNLIKLYPNPTIDGIFKVVNLPKANFNLEVYNIIGKLVYSKKLNATDNTSINISELSEGVYFVNLKNDTSNFTLKIVKK